MKIDYAQQERPAGIAQAFLIGEDFLGGEPACLILGDNLLFAHHLPDVLREAAKLRHGARCLTGRQSIASSSDQA